MLIKRTGITAPRGALFVAAAVALLAMGAAAPRAQAPARVRPAAEPARPPATAPAVKAPPRRTEAVRTLEAINIEGEIAVPQVLFITARDVRRYRDGLGLKFQLRAIDAGQAAVLPSALRVAPHMQSNQEEQR
jgi:hypothetical protein